MVLKVGEKEYKVKFGYNSFCDTDLMERTEDLINLFRNSGAEDDKDVLKLGKFTDLFSCVRDLLFFGFKKNNPVNTVQEVGDIIDDYHDEAPEGENRGVMNIFMKLSEELVNEGFLGEVLREMTAQEPEEETEQEQEQEKQKVVEMPQQK